MHLLRIEVDICAIVGCREGDIGRVGRIQQELGRVSHKGTGVKGEMVGVKLRQAKAQFTVGRIAIGRERRLTREIGVAIHANGLVDGLSGQLRFEDIPLQAQGIGRGHGEARSVVARHHLELVGDGRNRVEIEHELVGVELSRLIVKPTLSEEACLREEHLLMELARAVKHGIGIRFAVADLMDETE